MEENTHLESLKKIVNNITKDRIGEYSAQCAYYTILSFIPFLILLITLIQYTGIEQEVMFNAISRVIPASMNEFVIDIVEEVYSKSVTTISISAIFTLWSAGKGVFAFNKGLHSIYKTSEEDNTNMYVYFRLKALIETVLFIVLLVLGLVAMVFGSSLIKIIQNRFGWLTSFSTFETIITQIIIIAITAIIFALVYKFVPKHKVRFESQIYGAFFGAIFLNIVSFVFSRYLTIFKNFSITYGSLTTLMLILMWTYSCFYTIFLGAEVNKVISKIKMKRKKLLPMVKQ